MFKNLILYRIHEGWQPSLNDLEEALQKGLFVACGATQERSVGWVPPRGDVEGLLAEAVGGQWILRCMRESKMLPASVLQRKVEEKSRKIEEATGRKPGKKEKRDLKEEARLDLLPMAFTQQGSLWVWIDPAARLLMLDASNQGRADEVVTLLVDALPGFGVSLLGTQTSPQAAMAHWLLTQEAPEAFSIDRECELKSSDESKAVVRYARHPLDIDEVRQHVEHGKLPTKLAMTWDGRVSFLITESLQLRKVAFLETVTDEHQKDESGFDADVALATGELAQLIPDLIAALDGEGTGLPSEVPSQDLSAKPLDNASSRSSTSLSRGAGVVVTGPSSTPVDNSDSTPPF